MVSYEKLDNLYELAPLRVPKVATLQILRNAGRLSGEKYGKLFYRYL